MVEIILATHNHLDLTIQCVEALYAHTNAEFRLVVVDDSTDKLTPSYFSQLIEEKKNIQYLHSDIPYVHCNQIIQMGMDNTEGDIVAYLGNNVKVEPNWLDVAYDLIMKNPKVGIVGFKLLFPSGTIEHAGIFWTPEMPHHMNYGVQDNANRYTENRELDMVGWALVLLRKEALPKPLDTTTYFGFRGFDDIDNCLEVRKRGWKIIYCGYGCAYHAAGATKHSESDERKYAYEYEQNRLRFLKKWGGIGYQK